MYIPKRYREILSQVEAKVEEEITWVDSEYGFYNNYGQGYHSGVESVVKIIKKVLHDQGREKKSCHE